MQDAAVPSTVVAIGERHLTVVVVAVQRSLPSVGNLEPAGRWGGPIVRVKATRDDTDRCRTCEVRESASVFVVRTIVRVERRPRAYRPGKPRLWSTESHPSVRPPAFRTAPSDPVPWIRRRRLSNAFRSTPHPESAAVSAETWRYAFQINNIYSPCVRNNRVFFFWFDFDNRFFFWNTFSNTTEDIGPNSVVDTRFIFFYVFSHRLSYNVSLVALYDDQWARLNLTSQPNPTYGVTKKISLCTMYSILLLGTAQVLNRSYIIALDGDVQTKTPINVCKLLLRDTCARVICNYGGFHSISLAWDNKAFMKHV